MRELFSPPQKVALKIWAGKTPPDALKQLQQLARSEWLAGPVAVMPDVHSAGVVCVGTVLVTREVVLPTAVGEDLGCGMAVERLPLAPSSLSRQQLVRLVARVLEHVPVGRRSHPLPQEFTSGSALSTGALQHAAEYLGPRHVGTLGGGNHFIELQRDAHDRLWVTVHSGSRGVGAAIAAHHGRLAVAQTDRKLPWLKLGTPEAEAFWNDLSWALAFAAENRQRMHAAVRRVLSELCAERVEAAERFDVAHNLITRETFADREWVVHRKGAMPAALGSRGIIPGSMGTASYIVEGLGNPVSYRSCSHGAGRELPRTEARQRISLQQLRRELGDVVIPDDPRLERSLVEEAPSAYKPIKRVLAEQEDLVRPLLRLEPLAVIKG